MEQLIDKVVDALALYLDRKLRLEIPGDDPSRVDEVRPGRFQDDPVVTARYVMLHGGDPQEQGWAHIPTNAESNTPFGLHGAGGLSALPTFEIGGASMLWFRRFSAEIGAFFLNDDFSRDEARKHAHVLFGRLEYSIGRTGVDRHAGLLGLRDDFGEEVLSVILSRTSYTEGGGPPSDWIWRGIVRFDLLTAKNWD